MKKPIRFLIAFFLIFCFCMSTSAQNYSRLSDFPDYIKQRKQFKRFSWFYQQRVFPYNTIPHVYANQVYDKELKKIKKSSYRSFLEWTPKGPTGVVGTYDYKHWGIVSGRVRAIAVHPSDPLTVYIGVSSGGIWKTSDGGNNWEDIGRNLESLTFGAIAIDPSNPNTIYAGSGEPSYLLGLSTYNGRGLYKSIDGGNTWDTITDGLGQYTHFSDIVVSPHNPNILFAALTSGSFNLGTNMPNEGIWKSTDAGESWYKVIDQPYACDLMFHPTDENTVYACIGGMSDSSGFYISSDLGENWIASNNGLNESTDISRLLIDISNSNTDILYAVAYQPDTNYIWWGTFTNAYKSTNGGLNWQQISEGVPLGGNWGGWYDQGFYDLCIAIDPSDSDHVFIGNVELHETTDGENFTPVRPYGNNAKGSLVHVDYHQLVYAPSDSNYLYIGCDGGVYLSMDGCDTAVSKSDGLETFQVYRMDSHPFDPNIMIAGLQDNGTIMTHDGGETWTMVLTGDGMECFFHPGDPQRVYASFYNGYLVKSNNGGESFSYLKNMNGAWITPFFPHAQYPDTLYAANDDVYKYWGYLFNSITDDLSPVLINTMAQSRINPRKMILAGGGTITEWTLHDSIYPIMVSTNGGYNWTDVTENIPGEIRWITRVHTHPYYENTMYVVRCGFSDGNKIYITEDLGETWSNISGDLPDIPCNDLFIDPWNTDHIYVATDIGIYRSEDNGISYQFVGDGMPVVPVLDFDYVKIGDTRYLRVATFGRSIYETTNLPLGVTENISSPVTWLKVSPIPFKHSTTIQYELNYSGTVRITFYNQLGNQVDIIEENQLQGLNMIVWTPENLTDGIYYFSLRAGDQVAKGKMVVLR